MERKAPPCEVIHINLPQHLDSYSLAEVMVDTEDELLVRATLMKLPVVITWLDSDGHCFDHQLVVSKVEPFFAEGRGVLDRHRLENVVDKAVTRGAPISVILEDCIGVKSKFRLEFRPYQN